MERNRVLDFVLFVNPLERHACGHRPRFGLVEVLVQIQEAIAGDQIVDLLVGYRDGQNL